tara:strand:- start:126 stop:323 length:198 start_codon:yes stop_codon:yes gene_type:complete
LPDPRGRSVCSASQAGEVPAQKVSRGEAAPTSSNHPLYLMGFDYCAEHWWFCLAVFFKEFLRGLE